MSQIVINGNNIDILKTYPDNYFDAVVTDPPYGLGKEPNAAELMKDWVEFGYHEIEGKGFMGKEWDAFVPQPVFWKEVFRVLKHGGHVVAFYGTRTYDWGVMAMRFAGFEVRDCIQWIYGSGFPKSHNIGKAIDKIDGNEREVVKSSRSASSLGNKQTMDGGIANKNYEYTKGNSEWEGWGTALKPANEPIVLARKPLEKGLSVAENVLKWGTGGINIDGCRITTSDKSYFITNDDKSTFEGNTYGYKDYENMHKRGGGHNQGRFPANIILTHHPDCECKGVKKVKAIKGGNSGTIGNNVYGKFNGEKNNDGCGFADENGEETIENWECVEGCPIKLMDEQSGVSKSQRSERGNIIDNNVYGKYKEQEDTLRGHSDKGGASRFFYCAKASKSERNKGLEGFEEKKPQHDFGTDFGESRSTRTHTSTKNFHPTVKPVKLMQYLVRMITPPNGIVLDPFCGSGTTGVACKLEGYQFVGMEQDAEYSKIAEGRIKNYIENPKDYEEDTPEPETPTINNEDKPQLKLF